CPDNCRCLPASQDDAGRSASVSDLRLSHRSRALHRGGRRDHGCAVDLSASHHLARLRDRAARNPGVCAAASTCSPAVLIAIIATLSLPACVRPQVVAPPAGRAPVTLAVATWNMHAGKGDLARFVDDLASGRLTAAVPRDYVVLLQEDVERDNDPLGAVAATRHLFAFFLPLRRDRGAISGNAILSTQPFDQPRIIPLPRERQPRASAAANIQVAGERLFIATVHLENRLPWWEVLFSDTARGRQARALLQ